MRLRHPRPRVGRLLFLNQRHGDPVTSTPGFSGTTFHGAELTNFATTRKLTSSDPINFAPGTSLFLSVDMNAVTGGDNEVIIGCYSGAFGGGKGWVLERGQNTGTFNLLNWAGTYTVIGVQRLGVRLFAFRWQASDNHVWLSIDGAAAVDLGALTSPTMDGTCVSVIGTAAGVASVTDGPFLTGGVIDFSLIGSELNDAALAAATLVTTGSRFDAPASFASPLVDMSAYRDWDGAAGTFATLGSAPVTFTVTGAVSRTDISEVYYAAVDDMYSDSHIAEAEAYATGKTCTRRNTYARLSFTTDGTRAAIHQVSTIQGSYSGHYAAIGVNSNGTYATEGQNTAPNLEQITDVTLPAGAGKSIDLVEGPQAIIGGAIKGTYIQGFRVPPGSVVTAPVAPTKILVPIGDSAADGFLGVIPHSDGWTNVLRTLYYGGAGNVACHCVGSMGLYHLTVDAPTQAAAVAMAVAMAQRATVRRIVYIELAANDFYQNLISAATYQTRLTSYVNDIHAADPTIEIFFQTAIPIIAPASESANGLGSTLGDYRTAMTAVYTAFAGTKALLDGTALISVGNIGPDGIHPTTTGQAEIAGNVDTVVSF